MEQGQRLYKQMVDISRDYLGPAAERFINRQVTTHLHKEPSDLSSRDVPTLVDWIKLAFALLTNDDALVNEYADRLLTLSKKKSAKV